jgi:hypothetical protein
MSGEAMVFWIDAHGHLRHGPVLRHVADEVVVGVTHGQAVTLRVADLVPVPRFFTHGAEAGAASCFSPSQHGG